MQKLQKKWRIEVLHHSHTDIGYTERQEFICRQHADFLRQATVRVGVNRGNPNYEMFLLDHFPSWTPVRYTDTPACLEAVANRNADCIIISCYRFSDISRRCKRLNLATVYTGVDMDYCLAVRDGDTTLYSILARIISQVPETTVNAALNYYSAEPSPSFFEYLADNPAVTGLIALAVILVLVIFILLRRLTVTRRAAK